MFVLKLLFLSNSSIFTSKITIFRDFSFLQFFMEIRIWLSGNAFLKLFKTITLYNKNLDNMSSYMSNLYCNNNQFHVIDKGEKKKSGVNAFQAGPGTICEPRIMELISNLQTITTGDSTGGQFTTLTCRSIRIGSYKILTKEKVRISKNCQNATIYRYF